MLTKHYHGCSSMNKGIIYYTDNQIREPIRSTVMEFILNSMLPIVSVSLNEPIDFGNNVVLSGNRGYVTMIKQILVALQTSREDYVFFCEHDVLYPASHFDFTPPRDDIFYYNSNVWRWEFKTPYAIRYERMLPLSCLCVNRKFALDHYTRRMEAIIEVGPDAFKSREPDQARKWGYEPGTKKMKRGGFSDDDFETWSSKLPVIDIRHEKTFSPTKTTLESFKHLPLQWEETVIDKIPGWDLKGLFNL